MSNFWIKLKKILEQHYSGFPFEFVRDAKGNRKNPDSKVVTFIRITTGHRSRFTGEIPTSMAMFFVVVATIAIVTILLASKFGFI